MSRAAIEKKLRSDELSRWKHLTRPVKADAQPPRRRTSDAVAPTDCSAVCGLPPLTIEKTSCARSREGLGLGRAEEGLRAASRVVSGDKTLENHGSRLVRAGFRGTKAGFGREMVAR